MILKISVHEEGQNGRRIREKLREFLLECYGEDINEATGRKISVEGNCEGTEQ